jgi:hypothetical protein
MLVDPQRTVDARAELIARTKRGRDPLDSATHPLIQKALAQAVNHAYLAELRPFAKWIATALNHGDRAGPPITPPAVRPEIRLLPAPSRRDDDLTAIVAAAHRTAVDYGLHSDAFKSRGGRFAAIWDAISVRASLVGPRPRHREVDLFRLAFAHALATFMPEDGLGPTTFALLLAAIGSDDPIVRTHDEETVEDAIAVRASMYEEIWQRAARTARAGREQFILLPGRPLPLRSGKPCRLKPPFVHLSTGETVARRPTGIPVTATIVVTPRNKRRWFYARWREAGKQRSVALGPAA